MKNKKLKQLIAIAMIVTTIAVTVPAINPTVVFASEVTYATEAEATTAGFTFQLIDGNYYQIIRYSAPSGASTDITIPSQIGGKSVTSIGDAAFNGCSGLTSINIPSGVTSIGDYAFQSCSSLISITIPSSVTSIGDGAFLCCSVLTSITIPSSVISIGTCVFDDINNAAIFYVPNDAVKQLLNGKGYPTPGTTQKIVEGSLVAAGTSNITSVTDIADNGDGRDLQVQFDKASDESLVGSYRVMAVKADKAATFDLAAANAVAADNYTTVAKTGANITQALESGAKDTDGAVINNGQAYKVFVLSVADGTNATVNTLSGASTEITLQGGSSLPAVNSISVAPATASVKQGNTQQLTATVDAADGVDKTVTWSSSDDTTNNKVTVDSNGLVTVAADAAPGDYTITATSNADGTKKGTATITVTVPEFTCELTSDDTYKITGYMGSDANIEIPSQINGKNVTDIGINAFLGHGELTSIVIPDGVKSIGEGAFQSCTGLTSITIPNSVTNIGAVAFRYCGSLTSIIIPDSVTSMGNDVFGVCSNLTSIRISRNITSIGAYMFEYCNNLTSITIPSSATSIEAYAFKGCSSLKSINIPSGVTGIYYQEFQDCRSLTSINIPSSVTSINSAAFNNINDNAVFYVADSDTGALVGRNTSGMQIIPLVLTSSSKTATTATLAFPAIKGATSVEVQESTNGTDWTNATTQESLDATSTSATITGLTAGTSYKFRLLMNGNFSGSPLDVTTDAAAPAINSVSVEPATASVKQGNTQQLTATVDAADGVDKTVIWSSSDDTTNNKVTVDSNGLVTVAADAAPGDYTITATSNADATKKGTATITVTGFIYELNSDDTYKIAGYIGSDANIEIPSQFNGKNVTSIGDNAFADKYAITSITIPNSITNIGTYAFSECSNLTSVTIPNSVTSIGDSVFDSINNSAVFHVLNDVVKDLLHGKGYPASGTAQTVVLPMETVLAPTANIPGGEVASGTTVTLSSGTEGAEIYYTTDGSTPTVSSTVYTSPITVTSGMTIKAMAVKDGMTNSTVMSEDYTIMGTVLAPTASVPGGAVASGTTVTLSSGTEGAAIYYTTDGSTPTTSSEVYTAPITVTSGMTIKAIAVKDGMTNSTVMSEDYTIMGTHTAAVILTSDSLGRSGDSKITGLLTESKYKVTVDGTTKYVKADGTLSDSESDLGALSGTEITGLTNGTNYDVQEYTLAPVAPSITTNLSDTPVTVGGTTSFSVSASGTGLIYQWKVDKGDGNGFVDVTNDSIYSGATTDTLDITGADIAMNGYRYEVVVSGAIGTSVTSVAAVLTVNERESNEISVVSVKPLDNINVNIGTDRSSIELPETVDVELSNGSTTSAAVTWNSGSPTYDKDRSGTYRFTGALNLIDNILNNNRIKANVNVVVGDNTTTPAAVTYDLNYTAGDGGTITGDKSQNVKSGEDGSEVVAVPNSNYYFAGWSDGKTNARRKDVNVMSDVDVRAIFQANTSSRSSHSSSHSSHSSSKEQVTVNVTDGSSKNAVSQTVIERTSASDGSKNDEVKYTADKAQETITALAKEGKDTARIVATDSDNSVSNTQIDIPKDTLSALSNGKVNLEIETNGAIVSIPKESVQGLVQNGQLNGDLYFRVVPIKDTTKQEAIKTTADTQAAVKAVAGNNGVQVLGTPMTIETNMGQRPVDIILPLTGINLPTDPMQRQAFLNDLGVFIEHSDGEKVLEKGTVVDYGNGAFGIKFRTTKFSDFTIVKLNQSTIGKAGWKLDNGSWYFMNNDGTMAKGWHKANSGEWTYNGEDTKDTWFHLDADGKMNTGWFKDTDGSWYFLCDGNNYGALGVMETGWKYIDDTWYFLENNEAMATSWQEINGIWYYFNSDGSMTSNTTIDGYTLGSNGALI